MNNHTKTLLRQGILSTLAIASASLQCSCDNNSEPPKNQIAAWMQQCALPGVSVSDIESLSLVDQSTKTGRISIKLKATRTSPTYVVVDLDDYLRRHGVDREDFYLSNNRKEDFPKLYQIHIPRGATAGEAFEIETRLDVDGWKFSPARVGGSFEGLPAPPDNSYLVPSPSIDGHIKKIKDSANAVRRATQEAITSRTTMLKKLLDHLHDKKFKLYKESDPDEVVMFFQVTRNAEIEEFSNLSSFAAPIELDVLGGHQSKDKGLFKKNIVKFPITTMTLDANCLQEEDNALALAKDCWFTIEFRAPGAGGHPITFTYDGTSIPKNGRSSWGEFILEELPADATVP